MGEVADRGGGLRRHGDFVVVRCRYTGRGKGSGVDVDTHGAHLWTIRDGKALRLEIFSSRERVLAAAGIDPQGSAGAAVSGETL